MKRNGKLEDICEASNQAFKLWKAINNLPKNPESDVIENDEGKISINDLERLIKESELKLEEAKKELVALRNY